MKKFVLALQQSLCLVLFSLAICLPFVAMSARYHFLSWPVGGDKPSIGSQLPLPDDIANDY